MRKIKVFNKTEVASPSHKGTLVAGIRAFNTNRNQGQNNPLSMRRINENDESEANDFGNL